MANHPNSLLDPACVVAFAERPVRFLAKAPLFEQRDIAWLVRAAGSIPIFRRQDDPGRVSENDETFRSAERALLDGAAIGIFPEGITHDEPGLTPLKTGGARIALGTALSLGTSFPIVPVGLSFPDKAIFRSPALVIRGDPICWDDLAGRPPSDAEAVRELTRRIDGALRSVTVNLERWEDQEIVFGAEAIFAAENGLDPAPARRLERLRIVADRLAELRAEGSRLPMELGEEIRHHMMRLERFMITPDDLVTVDADSPTGRIDIGISGVSAATSWLVGTVGGSVFYVPYRLTGLVERRLRPDQTAAATHKLLAGILIFLGWYAALIVGTVFWQGPFAALMVAAVLPPLGIATLWLHDRTAEALRRAQRGLMLQRRRTAFHSLRQRQVALASRLAEVVRGE